MNATEGSADPLSELVGAEQLIGLDHLAFVGVYPLGLHGGKLRAFLRQQTGGDPYAPAAFLDLPVMLADPPPHFLALVQEGIVPDQKQRLLAGRDKLLRAPREKPGRDGAYEATIHEGHPRPLKLGGEEPVAGDGLGSVLGERSLHQAQRLSLFAPIMQSGQELSAPPALVLEPRGHLRIAFREAYQPVAAPLFIAYSGSGEMIQRLALCQRTRSLARVAQVVSALTRSSLRPSSRLTSAAISSTQRLIFLPKFLGRRWSNSRRTWALRSSKATWMRSGREEPGLRAFGPSRLKLWMASRTVCELHPRFWVIWGAISLRALAKSIWQRCRRICTTEVG